jgi:hypothetical protein
MELYKQIFEQNRVDLRSAAISSQSWFRKQVSELNKTNVTAEQLITADALKNTKRIIPGEMYLFAYDAKFKDTLPYWDKFPLVFPFSIVKGGFIGLNMHYLPYRIRIILLDKLMRFRTGKTINEKTRLRFSWELLRGTANQQWAEPCVHRYLSAHMKSQLKKIDAQDWATALLLPVESFVSDGTKYSKLRVWRNSVGAV